jgi:hypothetical protein
MASNTREGIIAARGDSASEETGAVVNNAPIAPIAIKYFACLNPLLFFLRFFFAFFLDLSFIIVYLLEMTTPGCHRLGC